MTNNRLFTAQRFLPLFIAQFMGAFNDNLYKNAMVILITYKIAAEQNINAQLLVTIAAALFILPFFLFSATAGQLADKYDRAFLTRRIKIAEIILVLLGMLALVSANVYFMLAILFGLGAQSTFFGPIKYALLPQYLEEKELLLGNAYVEAGTFLAILTGTILGGVLILGENGIAWVSVGLFTCALIGYQASLRMPLAAGSTPNLKISWNIPRETAAIIGYSRSQRDIFRCILGISWFWLIGATFLAQFPTYAKDVIGGDETVVTLLLTVFSIGIGIGSMLCNRLLKGHINATYVPLAAIALSAFTFDLYFASSAVMHADAGTLLHFSEFLKHGSSLRIVFDLLMIAICGGIYIVPLYAILQHRSEKDRTARVIASNNVMNALFMVGSAILTLILLKLHFTIPQIFLSVGVLNLAVALYIRQLVSTKP